MDEAAAEIASTVNEDAAMISSAEAEDVTEGAPMADERINGGRGGG